MEIISIICCESVIRDIETNNITLVNLIEGISVEALPLLIPKFSIFVSSSNEEINKIFDVDLEVKNNEIIIHRGSIKINFETNNNSRNIIRFNSLFIPTAGKLHISILKDGTLIKETTIEVLARKFATPA